MPPLTEPPDLPTDGIHPIMWSILDIAQGAFVSQEGEIFSPCQDLRKEFGPPLARP